LSKKLKRRFAEDCTYDVVKLFHGLRQVSSVDNYIDTFENIVGTVRRENPDIPETYYIKSFVAGLQDYEQHHTQIQKPSSLMEAYWIARRLEASNPFRKGTTSTWGQRTGYKQATREPVQAQLPKPAIPTVPQKQSTEAIAVKGESVSGVEKNEF
jgi:hypothetical protein